MTALTLGWFTLTMTGSAAFAGAVMFAQVAPYVLTRALVAPLVERHGAPLISALGAACTAVVVGAMAGLTHTGTLTYPLLLGLAVLVGVTRALATSSHDGVMPTLPPATGLPLFQAVGVRDILERAASISGILVAGLALTTLPGLDALWIAVAAFALESGLTLAAVGRPHERSLGPSDIPVSGLGRVEDAWRRIRSDRMLLLLLGVLAVTTAIEQAYVVAVVPLWAWRTGAGPGAVALVFAVCSVATLIGATLGARIRCRTRHTPIYALVALMAGFPRFLAPALGADVRTCLAVVAVGGLCAGLVIAVLSRAAVQRIPDASLERADWLAQATSWAAMGAGALFGGVVVTSTSMPVAACILGAGSLAATISPVPARLVYRAQALTVPSRHRRQPTPT